MKFCKFNKYLAKVLVMGFAFYCVIFLVSAFQAKRINQFVTYAQSKAAKQAATTEAVNQIEEVKHQITQIQGGIKRLQDEITRPQLSLSDFPTIITAIGAIGTLIAAIFILLQAWIARRTRQQEVFMSLVSELNKIKCCPRTQFKELNEGDRMELIVALHNYLDGVRDIIIREGNAQEGKIKKLKNEEDYQMRLLMWYKNLQIYYIDLNPEIDDLPSHWETESQEARSDPHIDPDSLICVEEIPPKWFHYFSKQQERIKKIIKRRKQRE